LSVVDGYDLVIKVTSGKNYFYNAAIMPQRKCIARKHNYVDARPVNDITVT
jgi:hypothetical protein